MKKRSSIFILVVLLLAFLQGVIAVTDPADTSGVLADQFGINKDKIPTSAEEIKQLYLKTQWTEFILKNKYLGPVHLFFEKNSWAFSILFAHPYEFSLNLFCIIVIWFLLLTQIAKMVEASGIVKGGAAFSIGFLITIALAQVRVISLFVNFLLWILFKQENWWIRMIFIVFFVGVILIEDRFARMFAKALKEQQERKRNQESDQKVKELKVMTEESKRS